MDLDKVKELIGKGMSGYEMAKELGIAQSTISKRLRKLGIAPNGYKSNKYLERANNKKYCETCNKVIRGKGTKCRPCSLLSIDQLKNPANKLRKLLLEKRGYRCENCRICLWQDYPITLELHHKDGDSKNNNEGNLQLLCPNCHSQSWDYRFTMNKVSSRRDERYKTERSLVGRET